MIEDRKRTRLRLKIALGAVAIGAIVWTIVKTERRVAELRGRGFTDVAIASTRDHAYLPLAGGLIGACVAILIAKGIGRLLRRP